MPVKKRSGFQWYGDGNVPYIKIKAIPLKLFYKQTAMGSKCNNLLFSFSLADFVSFKISYSHRQKTNRVCVYI